MRPPSTEGGRLALAPDLRKNAQNGPREDVMAYDLDQFIADCRSTLARDPGPSGRQQVLQNLERLLGNKDFVDKYCGDDQPTGIKVLYEDPKLGFQVLSHIMGKARVSPPHDHGKSWAIYGQAKEYTDMIVWQREDDGSDPAHAKLKPVEKYRLTPGKAGIYQDGAIHSIDYPDNARFVRVTGTDLDKIDRIKIDLKTGEVATMRMQAT
jgi:predicted metal-dependent enzyme (double-stranded beta helix superfamily)